MRHHPGLAQLLHSFVLWLLLIPLAACGGGSSSDDSADTASGVNQVAVPTMPPANFTAVANQVAITRTTTQSITQNVTTTTPVTTTSAAPAAASAADLERGARSYAKNKCGECHGEKGEGVAGKGKAIAGTALSATDFETVLRTGGGLGNTHIFGPSAVSPTGMGALYAYVESLK